MTFFEREKATRICVPDYKPLRLYKIILPFWKPNQRLIVLCNYCDQVLLVFLSVTPNWTTPRVIFVPSQTSVVVLTWNAIIHQSLLLVLLLQSSHQNPSACPTHHSSTKRVQSSLHSSWVRIRPSISTGNLQETNNNKWGPRKRN